MSFVERFIVLCPYLGELAISEILLNNNIKFVVMTQ